MLTTILTTRILKKPTNTKNNINTDSKRTINKYETDIDDTKINNDSVNKTKNT